MKTQNEKRYVGVKETLIYGIANGGQCIGYNMVRAQMSFFLVTVFGIDAEMLAAFIAFMAFWDAFNDPVMGALVDRTRTRFGKLRPYLMFSPIPLGITTILFFGGPIFMGDAPHSQKFIYMVITYFAWEFFYTIGDIPFWGLSAAISPNPADRSGAIKSARLISGIIGGVPGIIITVCIDLVNNKVIPLSLGQVFFVLGILAGTLGMFLFSLSGFCVKERVVQVNEETKLLDSFRYLFKNKPLFLLTLSSLIGTVEGIGGTFSVYFYTLSLGVNSLSLLVGLPGTIVGWVTYPLIAKLEKRWTSKQIVMRVSFMHAAVTVLVFLLGCRYYTNMAVVAPLLAIQSISGSINGSIKAVIPTKMISETVDYMEWKTGNRNEGMSFSILTFIGKLTGTLSTAIGTALIPMVGLIKQGETMVIDPSFPMDTKLILWALITCVPTVLGLLALIPYLFYDLQGEKLATIQREVQERRETLAQNIAGGNS